MFTHALGDIEVKGWVLHHAMIVQWVDLVDFEVLSSFISEETPKSLVMSFGDKGGSRVIVL
jgi:hypothetical protein